MEPLKIHAGLVAPLDRANVDTDQIIPKQFLKRLERSGYGQFLFHDWRCRVDGSAHPDFVLNQPRYRGATILVTGSNFGCGSSREHAVWALLDYGFRVIIAPSFADIFATNCVKNGVAPITLEENRVAELLRRAREIPQYRAAVDLESQRVEDGQGFVAGFQMDRFARHGLISGLDEIALTLEREAEIAAYEARRRDWTT